MSSSSRHGRSGTGSSPTRSTATYSQVTAAGQQKLNVVTRVAIEGKSKSGKGAAIKMYLKISLPLESVSPGATIALFPEENLKILDSQVHPLDANSVPYNFSSTTSPLLHRAARALNLPARSPQSYMSMSTASVTSTTSSASVPPVDDRYTGHVLVSGYQVSYVLPKEFPRRESDGRNRRLSQVAHFMAAIDMWAPFLSQPPQAPYLLSIPVPRCLSNHLKLRIFPPHPASAASSLASISSAEEDAVWDLTTDPHVTRGASNRISRSHSYTHFADDESSDASTSAGFADGCGIQGTFPSTERLRIRWATPLKAGQVPETVDGRRRVGIDEVKGDMTCFVLGKDRGRGSQGLMMRVQYEAICRGLWFPGVATLLALDVGLDAEDYDVSWVPGMESKWLISGGPGFTGFDVGGPPQTISRQSSEDMPPINVLPSSPETGGNVSSLPPARYDSPSPLASLLHAPLPAQNIADYSFEASPVSTPVSSTTSLPLPRTPEPGPRSGVSSVNGQYLDTDTDLENDGLARPPKVPMTVHLNLNDLLPPAKEEFKFNVSGTILLTPRQSTLNLRLRDSSPSQEYATSDSDSDSEPVVVPRFRVLYTGKESTSYTIVSEADGTAVDVYNSVGDIHNTQTRRTVLQKGGQIKCGMDGARIALHRLSSLQSTCVRGRRDRSMDSVRSARGRSRPLAPSGVTLRESSPSMLRQSVLLSNTRSILRRDGPLMIPFVTATITPLLNGSQSVPDAYAVQICLPAPSDADTEWLEFGLALPSADSIPSGSNLGDRSSGDSANSPPRVEVASASVEGVPVRFETSAAMKQDTSVTGLRLPFDETSAKEWMTWVRVHIGDLGGGKVEIVYLVKGKREGKGDENGRDKGKQRAKDQVQLNVLLPSFSLPVGRLEVNIQVQAGFELASLRTNLTHQQSSPQGRRLLHYSMEEFFYPRLSMSIVPIFSESVQTTQRPLWGTFQILACIIPIIASFALFVNLHQVTAELHKTRQSSGHSGATSDTTIPDIGHLEAPETVTVTTTIPVTTVTTTVTGSARWWFPQDSSSTSDPSQLSTALVQELLSFPSSTSLPTLTPTIPSMPASSKSPPKPTAVDLSHPPIPWTFRLELVPFELPQSARVTVETVIHGFGTVWQFVRKVMYYPLDPP